MADLKNQPVLTAKINCELFIPAAAKLMAPVGTRGRNRLKRIRLFQYRHSRDDLIRHLVSIRSVKDFWLLNFRAIFRGLN